MKDKKENELKLCPFCGATAQVVAYSSEAWVECDICGARSKKFVVSLIYCAKDEAAKAWNRRKAR